MDTGDMDKGVETFESDIAFQESQSKVHRLQFTLILGDRTQILLLLGTHKKARKQETDWNGSLKTQTHTRLQLLHKVSMLCTYRFDRKCVIMF